MTRVILGNRVVDIESICRAEYGKGSEPKAMMNANSYLHVYTLDGKDFTVFDKSADVLWEVLKDQAIDAMDLLA